jgi:hypothetical protein
VWRRSVGVVEVVGVLVLVLVAACCPTLPLAGATSLEDLEAVFIVLPVSLGSEEHGLVVGRLGTWALRGLETRRHPPRTGIRDPLRTDDLPRHCLGRRVVVAGVHVGVHSVQLADNRSAAGQRFNFLPTFPILTLGSSTRVSFYAFMLYVVSYALKGSHSEPLYA